MLFLYDPRTNILIETTYRNVEEITGSKKGSLMSLKSRKMKIGKINCYLVDEKVTLKQRKEWYIKEKYPLEVWKEIEGSDGKFLISTYGRVQRVYKNYSKFKLPYLHKKRGHLRNKVNFNGTYQEMKVGHLVAHHFLENPKPGEVLRHKNGIITDDFVGNLEYITKEKLGKKTGFKSKSKRVVQLDKCTFEVINEFRSAREAGRQCNYSYQAILDRCHRKYQFKSDKFTFMFADEYEEIYQEV